MKHPLRGLLVAQFFGGFNDNAWKLFVIFLSIQGIKARVGDEGPQFEAAAQTQTTIAFVVLTLPLILFSIPAGVLADRLSKRSLILAMKAVEVLLMATGTVLLLRNPSGGIVILVILALMGAQSALFIPAKYGILPELLPHERLSAGNGTLEFWTFLAIIAGTIAGGVLLESVGASTWIVGLILTGLAMVGFVGAWAVPRVPAARSAGGIQATLSSAWAAMRADRVLWLAVLGAVFFWAIASLMGQDILVYGKVVLHLSDTMTGVPLVGFAVGIGIGSVIAGKMSASKVEYGLIPLGTIGLACLTFLFGIFQPGLTGTLVLMVLMGLSSGLIVVPLQAILQWRSPKDRRGAVIALANVFAFTGILVGSLGAHGLSQLGLSSGQIFTAASVILFAGTIWAIRLLPDALLRLVLVLLTHTFYRLRVVGRGNVPQEGGALLVPNHVSFVDGLLLIASIDRPIRFVVEADYFHRRLLRPFMRSLGAIPITTAEGPKSLLRSLRDAGAQLDEGELVCIFPEGQITRTGMLLPFRRGLERIIQGRTAPIVPVNLDRVWGSIFSRAGGQYARKIPERIPYPVTVAFGAALPADTSFHAVRRSVHDLSETAWSLRKGHRPPLHHTMIRTARRRPFRFAMADGTRPRLSRLGALAGAIALARALRPHWKEQPLVGILLPASVAGALVNVAAALGGRTSVNLNYTAGRAGMEAAARQSGLRTVVTSRSFIEKAKIELPGDVTPVWIEDVGSTIGPGARLLAFGLSLFAPIRTVERACGATRRTDPDDIVTVIFSSGSTGEPKGVILSHFNIDSNVEAAAQVFRLESTDRFLGILPFFHSFGYMATVWLTVNHGLGAVYHANPLDGDAIGRLVQRYRVTFLLTTPTFLQLYLRRCTPAQFGSLRVVLAGAEKLSERLAQAFEDHFGIRPLEGYGTTECSPIIAVSAPEFRAPGFYQPGSRRGFVGQPLPGVSVRVVDPESFEPVTPGDPGMLLVKGPNVMRGYLKRDDLTAQVMRDGWYVTGDIALIDEDGFIKITDRLSRFSKIGGEMVPHGRIEQALQEAAGEEIQVFAVTAVPDESKGERLAVLHTLGEQRIPDILDTLANSGLPNVFIPRPDQFMKVEQLPVLGTGKLDLREVKRIATTTFASKASR